MSTAVRMQFETQAQTEKEYPRKRKCACEVRSKHFFIARTASEIFCSDKCKRLDDMDRPR